MIDHEDEDESWRYWHGEYLFGPGERVQVRDVGTGEWKDGAVTTLYMDPGERLPDGTYGRGETRYDVICDGREDPQEYRSADVRLPEST